MQPTLKTNNILLCSKIAQRFNKINRNDIVIAIHPSLPQSLICKRVIGLEGDIVIMNSTSQHSSYDDKDDDENVSLNNYSKTIVIKRGSAWIEGDNRINSTDSRNYGQIPVGLIRSKVIARVWPLDEFRLF